MTREASNSALFLGSLGLTLASLYVVIKGAGDEPYMIYYRSDALVQVGLGGFLTLLWCAGMATITTLVARRKISKPWLAMTFWGIVCVIYLSNGIAGYLGDIEHLATR